MGRNIPSYHDYNHNYNNDHPLLSLTFLIACIAATIAVVSSLCGALSRKKPPGAPVGEDETTSPRNQENIIPSSSPPKAESTTTALTQQPPEAVEESNKNKNEGSKRGRRRNGDVAGPLPPPPARSSSCHVRSHSTPMNPPGGKLESSMSMRVSTGSAMRQGSRRAENNKTTKYLKHEDSIWKKAIILGEKCRVPDEDEVVYDEKGNRISTYHPKTKSNAFEILSRQNSNADPEKPIHNA